MTGIDAFFNQHTGFTNYRDSHGSIVGMDMPDHLGGTIHTDGMGTVTGHSHPDFLGGTHIHDAAGHMVGGIHHDALGHDHLTGSHGDEILSAKPNIFHGHDLFLADGQTLGHTSDLGGGHLHVQADPLVGMNNIRFPQFHV